MNKHDTTIEQPDAGNPRNAGEAAGSSAQARQGLSEGGNRPAANDRQNGATPPGTGFWAVVQSVLAAGIGVQSQANKERDFQQGDPKHFIIGGIIGTLLLIGGIVLLVQFLLW